MNYKKQHFLSEFYLKGFGKDNPNPKSRSKQNWVYFLNEKKLQLKEPQNFACKSYFYSKINADNKYDHSLEHYFHGIENEVKYLFNNISKQLDSDYKDNNFNFDMKDRILLILFVFWSMKKTPLIKEKLQNEIISKIKEDFGGSFLLHIDEIRKFANNSSIDLLSNLDGNNDIKIFEILFNKNIHFIISRNDSSFLTTDNPVVVFNPTGKNGIIYERSEIYFALNHKILLMLHENGENIKVLKLPNKSEQRKLNITIAANASEIIVAKDKEYLIRILKELKYEYA